MFVWADMSCFALGKTSSAEEIAEALQQGRCICPLSPQSCDEGDETRRSIRYPPHCVDPVLHRIREQYDNCSWKSGLLTMRRCQSTTRSAPSSSGMVRCYVYEEFTKTQRGPCQYCKGGTWMCEDCLRELHGDCSRLLHVTTACAAAANWMRNAYGAPLCIGQTMCAGGWRCWLTAMWRKRPRGSK